MNNQNIVNIWYLILSLLDITFSDFTYILIIVMLLMTYPSYNMLTKYDYTNYLVT